MLKKIKHISLVVLFVLSIATPFLWNHVAAPYLDRENHEKRTLAQWPAFSLAAISKYPGLVQAYFDDHLPFKNELVQFYNRLEIGLFHASSSKRVAVGKDGWLFYKDTTDGDPISDYRGKHLLSESELEQIARNMQITKDNLEAEGREFIIFIPPNKERVYSEYMSDYYGEPAEMYPVRQIVEYLRAHTDVKVVYPYQALMDAKAALGSDINLYNKTDTHWNELGAYIGTRELLHALGIELPALDAPEITIEKSKKDSGDLANILNIGAFLDHGYQYVVSGIDFHDVKAQSADEHSFTSVGADGRTLVMVRDSFGDKMRYYIGSQFSRSDLFYWDELDIETVRARKADIVVLETVERYVPFRLKNFQYTRGIYPLDPSQYEMLTEAPAYRWNIDRIDTEEARSDHPEAYTEISGWFIKQGEDAVDGELQIVIKKDDDFFALPTTIVQRPDVTQFFHESHSDKHNYDSSGFTASFLTQKLELDETDEIYAAYSVNGENAVMVRLN